MPHSANIWAPVAAAIGASLLTGLVALVLDWRGARRRAHEDLRGRRQAAYGRMLAASGLLAHTAGGLHQMIELRSGVKEGVALAARLRRPVEPIDFIDLLRRDLEPLYEAWSQVWAAGSPPAVEASNLVMERAGEVLSAATTPGTARNRLLRYLAGERWSDEERAVLDADIRELAIARRRLAELARRELGIEATELFSRHSWTGVRNLSRNATTTTPATADQRKSEDVSIGQLETRESRSVRKLKGMIG